MSKTGTLQVREAWWDFQVTNELGAFLSYTRVDDEFFGGAITALRKFLEQGVHVVTGDTSFSIFQDVDGIEFGQRWQRRLDDAISSARFLIPIMTPCFFQSAACRDELDKFIKHEETLGRDDLILPIYFITTPLLEKKDLLESDSLASNLSARQRHDWRDRADLPITDAQVRRAVLELAEKIAAAITRTKSARVSIAQKTARESAFEEISGQVQERKQARDSKPGQKKILWVDDRPNNNIYERRAMEAYSLSFVLARSTGEALAELRKDRFDAIISDMGRPPDSQAGYTLLEALRGSGDDTPYFIYAGSNSPKHLREALSRGAQWSTNSPDELIGQILKELFADRLPNSPSDNRS